MLRRSWDQKGFDGSATQVRCEVIEKKITECKQCEKNLLELGVETSKILFKFQLIWGADFLSLETETKVPKTIFRPET